MRARRKGRIDPREQQRKLNAAFEHLGMPQFKREIKPVRKRSASGKPLERDVLKAVIQALRMDKRVASVERNQSGVFQDGNRFVRVGTKGKLDLTIYLRDGRYIEAEVKRAPDVKLLSEAQQLRISQIRGAGGLAGWCWSVESALALLPNE